MTRPPQVLVGGVVGAMVATLAIAAHGTAGGDFPGSAEGALMLLVAALTGSAAAVLPSARSRLGVLGVLALLAAGQFASHSVLSEFNGHDHAPASAQLPGGWMLAAHAVATVVGAALILLAQRLYLVASGALRSALTRPREPRPQVPTTGWAAPGVGRYGFHPNGAIGPRAPPVPA
ncbi:hypothetical protein [Nocardia sp. XZ_19_385]|uniref:hypothetical protein n=1 Tax=Nocardia sp. XZ_19_385 TaxID=2769488 RepID=UPI00188E6643|nr:hypothetical protein [Nocardia sp. XZ_19_385]